MLVTDAVARALTGLGVDTVFGVVGSGNFHLTNALIARGARYVAARHECGAASMADAWARLTGQPGVLSSASGPGHHQRADRHHRGGQEPDAAARAGRRRQLRRRDVELPASTWPRSRPAPGQRRPGCTRPAFAIDDAVRAYRTARDERRTVVLALPLDVQAGECTWPGDPDPRAAEPVPPDASQAAELAALLATAARPGVHRRAGRAEPGRQDRT